MALRSQAWRDGIEPRCREIDLGDVGLVPWEEPRKRLVGRDSAARACLWDLDGPFPEP